MLNAGETLVGDIQLRRAKLDSGMLAHWGCRPHVEDMLPDT